MVIQTALFHLLETDTCKKIEGTLRQAEEVAQSSYQDAMRSLDDLGATLMEGALEVAFDFKPLSIALNSLKKDTQLPIQLDIEEAYKVLHPA